MDRDRIALRAFVAALMILAAGYGYLARDFGLFPHRLIANARATLRKLGEPPDWQGPAPRRPRQATLNGALAYDGLNVLTSVTPKGELSIRLAELDGRTIHEWKPDWFSIWPDARHVAEKELPQSRPGTHVHGTHLTPEGDVVFNFERLGLVKLDACSKVVWRLPMLTHHSVEAAEDGTLWVTADQDHTAPIDWLPSYKPPFVEPLILQVSREGKVLRRISILEVLAKNGLTGLLLIRNPDPWVPTITGDTLHLNDVEVFPSSLTPGAFQPGDILFSLRNVDTVIVLDGRTLNVKFRSTGALVGQHDPDFQSGDSISVLDNNNSATEERHVRSRIVLLSPGSDSPRVLYAGTSDRPFFTHKMGKHQVLPNGNFLITESFAGRAFEVTPAGKVVFEVSNQVDEHTIAIVEEARRVPRSYGAAFTRERLARCGGRLAGTPRP